MLSNFHTHTVFCDGKSSAEEVVLSAIAKGFNAIGFSGHGYTDFDLSYCIKDMNGYIEEINRLKEKYKEKIQIYLGVEEDSYFYVNRADFDYIIGSSHYFNLNGKYIDVDMSRKTVEKCIADVGGDALSLAESYYSAFCDYILKRKPDIIGHFDLITKFDQMGEPLFSNLKGYYELAEKYLKEALKANCIFEVNTGAISRGCRTTPYPDEKLLYILKKENAKLILSSDSHSADTIDCAFKETKQHLKDIGFRRLYTIDNGKFVSYDI